MNKRPIVIIGGGGHARVVADSLLASHRELIGFVDRDPEKKDMYGLSRLGKEAYITTHFSPEEIVLANGIGSIRRPDIRRRMYIDFKEQGFEFTEVIHPGALLAASVVIGEGVQIMAGAIVQPGTILGENAILNTRASIDHDCRIGAHVHIAPGATLSGNVEVGDNSHIGTGASIIHGIKIGADSIVGAGSVVVRNVDDGATVMGVPAVER